MRPNDITSADDPKLRKLMKMDNIPPFPKFYRQQLKLQQQVRTPNESDKKNFKEKDSYHVGDCVYLDYSENTYKSQNRPERFQIFRIAEVETTSSPYLFKLFDLKNQLVPG